MHLLCSKATELALRKHVSSSLPLERLCRHMSWFCTNGLRSSRRVRGRLHAPFWLLIVTPASIRKRLWQCVSEVCPRRYWRQAFPKDCEWQQLCRLNRLSPGTSCLSSVCGSRIWGTNPIRIYIFGLSHKKPSEKDDVVQNGPGHS